MITVEFKLVPTKEQEALLHTSATEYVNCVNMLTSQIVDDPKIKLSTAHFQAMLPSAVKNEAINAAKSVVAKFKSGTCKSLPVLRKSVITWNNQNYKIFENTIEFPLWIDGKSKRISVIALLTEYQSKHLVSRLGSLRITQKNGKWIAQIAVEVPFVEPSGVNIMGVDLGLKNPAVAVVSAGSTKFFGNGRQNKYEKRKHRSKRKALGKAKKQKAIEKANNKEQRWMKDRDHKISREIVNYAEKNQVSVIHMEQLQNIRTTARTSRKNEKNLHTWSFYRLTMFIVYKAALLGIKVEFVNPAYTSQKCPLCSRMNKAKDRKYKCVCGFKCHRDRVGAMNIINAPVVSDKRKPA